MMGTARAGWRRYLLAICVIVGVGVIPPATASATYPWANQDAMRDEVDPELRDTFIVDPGRGGTISRARFRSQPYSDYYDSFGLDRNFFTWAPAVSVGDGYVSGRRWTACTGTQVSVPGGPSHCAAGAVKLGTAAKFVRESVLGGPLTGFKWGEAFISNICGNWSPTNGEAKASPVPRISGVKYEDLNADGDRDAGEPGLAGWTIRLLYNGKEVATTTTGGGGAYSFSLDAETLPIGAGTYEVRETLKAGWHQSDAPGPIAVPYGVGNKTFGGRDFGNWEPAIISGHKFDDSGVDGEWDPSEVGLAGWTMGIDGGSISQETVTGTGGAYAFSVRPGTYVIGETVREGWRQTAPGAPGTHGYTVVSGQVVENVDFGNVCLGSVSVEPLDGSTGEPLTGLEVRIEEIDVPELIENEPPLPRTTTATPTFDELLPGTYRVVAFLPEGVYSIDPEVVLVEGRFAFVKEVTVSECEATEVPLAGFTDSTGGKVTGGIVIDVPGGWANSGFQFQVHRGEARGTLQYVDHVTGLNLHTKAIEAIEVDGDTAWVWGSVEVEGVERRFRLVLVDAGEPGTGDRFELAVEGGYEAGHGATIASGNVQVH